MISFRELDANSQAELGSIIQFGIQSTQFKPTERKRSMAYFCFGPDIRTNVQQRSKTPIFYFVDASGRRTAEQAFAELLNSSSGGSYVYYDNTRVDKESLERKMVKCKSGGMMIPWTQAFNTGSQRRFLAMYDKTKLGRYCNNKQGAFLVCAIDNAGNLAPEAGIEVLSGEAFAKLYSLNAFPGIIKNVDIDIEKPADLFERLTADDTLKASDINELIEKISNDSTFATATRRVKDGTEIGWDVAIVRIDSPCALILGIDKDRAEALQENAVAQFKCTNGTTGATIDSSMSNARNFIALGKDGNEIGFSIPKLMKLFESNAWHAENA